MWVYILFFIVYIIFRFPTCQSRPLPFVLLLVRFKMFLNLPSACVIRPNRLLENRIKMCTASSNNTIQEIFCLHTKPDFTCFRKLKLYVSRITLSKCANRRLLIVKSFCNKYLNYSPLLTHCYICYLCKKTTPSIKVDCYHWH